MIAAPRDGEGLLAEGCDGSPVAYIQAWFVDPDAHESLLSGDPNVERLLRDGFP